MKRKSAIILMLSIIVMVMAEVPLSFIATSARRGNAGDSVKASVVTAPDSLHSLAKKPLSAIGHDSVLKVPTASDTAALDTTKMDSVSLAIYRHNKAIDDSLAQDSINRSRKNGIDSPVEYSADDSLTYESLTGLAHLYGESKVKYQNMDLASEKIYMSLDSNLVHATGKLDSTTQKLTGTPVFKMGKDEYESDTMAFNFKSKKGLITGVYTQQDEGFLTSEISKRGANGEMFLEHGRYTTCDDPHPDFYLALSRAKVRPGKDVVFGPAYLVVADVPLPLAVPYGFFPFTKSYSSGLIMPTYGDETEKGFYLRNGGYYFALNDKMDLKLIGEIYTKGSWGLTATSNYKKRYRYGGSFLFSYQNSVRGEKNMPDYAKETSFKLQWSHRQDAKANPFTSLSASVNFASTSYERNNLTSMYNPQALTQTTRTSSINWGTTFSSLKMSISTQANLNQNMRDSSIYLTLPSLNITVSRVYPFRRKKMAGDERWYEKINFSYTGDIRNEINTKESKLMHSSLSKDWKNGMKHTIPIQANFTILGYLNVNPQFNFTDRMYLSSVRKSWDPVGQKEVADTVSGFHNVYDWNFGIGLTTTLYGFWIPNRKLFGDKIQAIRHVVTPSVSLRYAPDFSDPSYGFYKQYQKTDADGNVTMVNYDPYQGMTFGSVSKGKQGTISFDIGNNLEMKVKSEDDSTGFKKISLIDELKLSSYYNFATDYQPMGPVAMNLRLKFSKSLNLSLSTSFASYVYEVDSLGNISESAKTTYWQQGKIGRFQGLSQNFSFNFNNEKINNFIKWLKGEKVDKKKDKKKKEEEDDDWDTGVETNIDNEMEKAKRATKKGSSKADTDEDGYLAFKIPWNLTIGYGITMSENRDKSKFNYETMRYPYKFNQNLNVSGSVGISDGWNITYSSGYDFDNKKISMTRVGLSRDLHCFNMSCDVVLAPYTSYNFSFRCNASTLTDALKYDKRSSYSNAVQWY